MTTTRRDTFAAESSVPKEELGRKGDFVLTRIYLEDSRGQRVSEHFKIDGPLPEFRRLLTDRQLAEAVFEGLAEAFKR